MLGVTEVQPLVWPNPGVYAIICYGDNKIKSYIGKSLNVQCRVHSHLTALRDGNHSTYDLLRAYKLLGHDSFECRLLQKTTNNPVDLTIWEQYWIDAVQALDPTYGFNTFNTGYRSSVHDVGIAPHQDLRFWEQYPLIKSGLSGAKRTQSLEARLSTLISQVDRCSAPKPELTGHAKTKKPNLALLHQYLLLQYELNYLLELNK